MWQLIKEKGLIYFQYQYENLLFLYSTRDGVKNFLKKFNPFFLKQIHSDIIVDLDNNPNQVGDGIITTDNKAIGIKVADCLPVYLFNEEKICILHCGWRSIIKGIIERAIKELKTFRYCLGASIGPCCYEIKDEVARYFEKKYPNALKIKDCKIFLDLKEAVREILGEEKLIADLNYCTKCHPEYFYSYRRGDFYKRNYAVFLKVKV